jgi:hypothetical protein
MVRVEMRNDHSGDLFQLDSGCRHIGDHRSGSRLKLTVPADVEENRFGGRSDQPNAASASWTPHRWLEAVNSHTYRAYAMSRDRSHLVKGL